MSADNQMKVAKHKNNWYVYMQLGDHPYPYDHARKALYFKEFTNKDKAVGYAREICKTELVEYGIGFEG